MARVPRNKGLTGINRVMRNINREVSKMKRRSMKGLIEAAIHIRRDMDRTPPKIPIDTGNLRASWFMVTAHNVTGPVVIIGFSANYAAAVHENLRANFKRPGSGAHFFSAALKRNQPVILNIIAKNIRK